MKSATAFFVFFHRYSIKFRDEARHFIHCIKRWCTYSTHDNTAFLCRLFFAFDNPSLFFLSLVWEFSLFFFFTILTPRSDNALSKQLWYSPWLIQQFRSVFFCCCLKSTVKKKTILFAISFSSVIFMISPSCLTKMGTIPWLPYKVFDINNTDTRYVPDRRCILCLFHWSA